VEQKAPLPKELPGDFFLLEWNRDLQSFIIHLDDDDASSHNLGGNIQAVMMRFKLWGLKAIGNSAIDIAKEFGAAQAIPAQNRCRAVFDREAFRNPKLQWKPSHVGQLPTLE
jgi:hypothetical protein